MSEYRPYVDLGSFRYPTENGKKAFNLGNSSLVEDNQDTFEFLDLDDIVSGQSQLSGVGLSISRFYASMLVSQPFEVSRFLLQVGEWDDSPHRVSEQTRYEDYDFDDESASSTDEEVDYFVDVRDMASRVSSTNSSTSTSTSTKPKKVKPSKIRDVRLFKPDADNMFPEAVRMEGGPYIFSIMGALSDKEGVFSLWRGLNSSCLCYAATGVVKAWVTSFLASLLGIPDPQFVDILQVPDPGKLILVGTAGCAITAALLAPLFMIRARLLATSMSNPDRPRSLRWSLLDIIRRGQLLAPYWVTIPTTLAATVNHAVLATAPVVLWKYCGVDAFSSPRLYQFSELGASLVGLSVKMPLETIASRAQLRACHPAARTLIVKPANYQGVLPTLWDVVVGHKPLSTLYRGWRSEVVGLLGEWGYDALDEARPTQQERF